MQFISAIIAIFTAIIGFYVTTVVEELRSGTTLVYSVERQNDGNAFLTIKNVSRMNAIDNLHVGMTCVDNKFTPCFLTSKDSPKPSVSLFAPIKGEANVSLVIPIALQLRVSLVAGAKIQAKLPYDPKNTSKLLFSYFPDNADTKNDQNEDSPNDLNRKPHESKLSEDRTPVFIKGSSVSALFIEHYFNFMALAMTISSILLGIALSIWAFKSITSVENLQGDTIDEHPELTVNLNMSNWDARD